MAIESNVSSAGKIFAGVPRTMRVEVLAFGADQQDPNALMQDVTGWTFQYTWRKRVRGIAPHRLLGELAFQKSSPSPHIVVTGSFHPNRSLNTQRVEVLITAADTAALAGGDYVDALKRIDPGYEDVICYGVVPLLIAATG
jgi:hypothetical protein